MNNDNMGYVNDNRTQSGDVAGLAGFFRRMYRYMALALLVSGVTAYVTATMFPQVMQALASNRFMFYGLMIFELVLVVLVNTKAMRNAVMALPLLVLYAVVNGLTMSFIFAVYAGASILGAFAGAAAIFVGMSAYGYVTKRNMAGLGTHLFGLLIGLLVASVVNIFLHNSVIALVLSWASVIIFTLLSAYDTNKMKQLYIEFGNQSTEMGLAVSGALTLYLDFINIFLSLLQIFGGSNRD
ncbi:Bax inhibitor-1/YccA family protein [Periweissella fabaria]|uniref:Inner membrane protein YbhL n=1 Tax=Periweissella fabaria TaxID=546157 RepID=A0ABM8Z787_9LACO|nr:Bax inhibitor-1/YccA family protein [Periweissella fabaria]MCM0597832.1 Bax inhibitor-1/YccA family protein [Periweissella fabaria]CAH0417281.1 Inner membrane protein YbhL [Periweissella fabaria]